MRVHALVTPSTLRSLPTDSCYPIPDSGQLSRQRFSRIVLLRHVPLVAALVTLAVLATRLRELHLGADIPALRTFLGDGLVPHHEIAALVRARVERRAALARAALHELTAVLGAEHASRHRARPAAFGERAATEELTAPPLADDHRRATQMALVLRHHRLGALALERTGVLALLRVILAGEERTEESAARLELAAAIRTTQLRDLGQVVGRGDEGAGIDFVE